MKLYHFHIDAYEACDLKGKLKKGEKIPKNLMQEVRELSSGLDLDNVPYSEYSNVPEYLNRLAREELRDQHIEDFQDYTYIEEENSYAYSKIETYLAAFIFSEKLIFQGIYRILVNLKPEFEMLDIS